MCTLRCRRVYIRNTRAVQRESCTTAVCSAKNHTFTTTHDLIKSYAKFNIDDGENIGAEDVSPGVAQRGRARAFYRLNTVVGRFLTRETHRENRRITRVRDECKIKKNPKPGDLQKPKKNIGKKKIWEKKKNQRPYRTILVSLPASCR